MSVQKVVIPYVIQGVIRHLCDGVGVCVEIINLSNNQWWPIDISGYILAIAIIVTTVDVGQSLRSNRPENKELKTAKARSAEFILVIIPTYTPNHY